MEKVLFNIEIFKARISIIGSNLVWNVILKELFHQKTLEKLWMKTVIGPQENMITHFREDETKGRLCREMTSILEILEDLNEIKSKFETCYCYGDHHHPLCQALTRLYWKIQKYQEEINLNQNRGNKAT